MDNKKILNIIIIMNKLKEYILSFVVVFVVFFIIFKLKENIALLNTNNILPYTIGYLFVFYLIEKFLFNKNDYCSIETSLLLTIAVVLSLLLNNLYPTLDNDKKDKDNKEKFSIEGREYIPQDDINFLVMCIVSTDDTNPEYLNHVLDGYIALISNERQMIISNSTRETVKDLVKYKISQLTPEQKTALKELYLADNSVKLRERFAKVLSSYEWHKKEENIEKQKLLNQQAVDRRLEQLSNENIPQIDLNTKKYMLYNNDT